MTTCFKHAIISHEEIFSWRNWRWRNWPGKLTSSRGLYHLKFTNMLNSPFWRKKERISQLFWERPEAYAQFWWKGHNGIDFAVPVWTKIFSTHPGIVKVINSGKKGYGLHVKIMRQLNDWGYETIYAHLSKVYVKDGDFVTSKNILWDSGNTGNSTGPHLHFWLRFYDKNGKLLNQNNGYGWWVDCMPYFINGKI